MGILINLVMGTLSFIMGIVLSARLGAGSASVMWGLCMVATWAIIYITWGLRQVEENSFLVVERFGEYRRTVGAGLRLLCLPGVVDRTAPNGGRGDFKWHRLDLYDNGTMLDFTDASAGLKAQVWYRIKNENRGPWNYVYKVVDSESRVKELTDGTIRAIVQSYTVDGASANLGDISSRARIDQGLLTALDDIGVEIDPQKGVIVTDIVLSQDLIDIRQESIKGKRQADRQREQGDGYARAILAVMERFAQGVKNDGGNIIVKPITLTFNQAKEVYERQRALETIQSKPGDTHFISPDIGRMQIALGINQGQGGKKP